MIFPPSILHYRNVPRTSHRIGCWLPLILLWPVLLALGLLLTAILVIRALLGGGWRPVLLAPRLLGLFCRLRGLRIDSRNDGRAFRLMLI